MSTKRLGALVVVLAALLRLLNLGTESYWFDEIIMVRLSTAGLETILEELGQGRPALYVLLSQLMAWLFGTSEIAGRMLSAVAGTLAVAALIPVGGRLFGREVGVLAAFLMALSEFNIYYSQEHRYYALFACLAVVSMWTYLRLLDSWTGRDAALYALSSVALFHAHHFGLAVIAAQNAFLLLERRRALGRWGLWWTTQGLILLGMLPVLVNRWSLIGQGRFGPTWVGAPSLDAPLLTLWRFFYSIREGIGWGDLVPVLLVVVVADTALRLGGWRPPPREWRDEARAEMASRRSELRLVALWLLLPIGIPLAVSLAIRPIYVDRYMIGASPALYLLLAFAVRLLRRRIPVLVFVVGYAALVGPVLASYYDQPLKEQWREVAEYVSLADRKGDAIVFLAPRRLARGRGGGERVLLVLRRLGRAVSAARGAERRGALRRSRGVPRRRPPLLARAARHGRRREIPCLPEREVSAGLPSGRGSLLRLRQGTALHAKARRAGARRSRGTPSMRSVSTAFMARDDAEARLSPARLMSRAMLSLLLVKLILVSVQSVAVLGWADHDDRLFVRLAGYIDEGAWLGPYDRLTLAKGPAYPIWIAVLHRLQLPLLLGQHLLYGVACWVVVRALGPLGATPWLRLALFGLLLFNPLTFGQSPQRVIRAGIYPALTLFVIAGAVGVHLRHQAAPRTLARWSAGLGLALAAFWLTREEGIWLLPSLALLIGTTLLAIQRSGGADRRLRLLLSQSWAPVFLAAVLGVCGLNLFHYGVFVTVEFKHQAFLAAYGSLSRIEPEKRHRYVPVPREAREQALRSQPDVSRAAAAPGRARREDLGAAGSCAQASGRDRRRLVHVGVA